MAEFYFYARNQHDSRALSSFVLLQNNSLLCDASLSNNCLHMTAQTLLPTLTHTHMYTHPHTILSVCALCARERVRWFSTVVAANRRANRSFEIDLAANLRSLASWTYRALGLHGMALTIEWEWAVSASYSNRMKTCVEYIEASVVKIESFRILRKFSRVQLTGGHEKTI